MPHFYFDSFYHGLVVTLAGDVQYVIQFAGEDYTGRVRTESLQTGSISKISTALNTDLEGVWKLHLCKNAPSCPMKLNVAQLTLALSLKSENPAQAQDEGWGRGVWCESSCCCYCTILLII